jgi:hypothetical protein
LKSKIFTTAHFVTSKECLRSFIFSSFVNKNLFFWTNNLKRKDMDDFFEFEDDSSDS